MAFASGGVFNHGRKSSVSSSRNIAFMSMIGVITGTVLLFKAMKPGPEIVTNEERYAMRGGNASPANQTDQGTIRSSPRPKPQAKKGSD